jgi:hypothetical protein
MACLCMVLFLLALGGGLAALAFWAAPRAGK